MSGKTNPCKICGCTDLNLVDGFYYCVECGTQDVNVRETIVDYTILQDGTVAISEKRKIHKVQQESIQMSGEWLKWHAYNFILANLTEELIAVGAKPTLKMKVQWIWVRYIKKFQKRDEPEVTQFTCFNEEDKEELSHDSADSEPKKGKKDSDTEQFNIDIITPALMLSMLYVGLNLDKSHIQLRHLFQFIREGRLSIYDCKKFIPKELSTTLTPNLCNFLKCRIPSNSRTTRALAMSLLKQLDLGVPLMPDLNRIVDSFTKELCLPNDFKNLVLSLMDLIPLDNLHINNEKMLMMHCNFIPDYETVCMSYILLALKMCFGLDSVYDVALSDAVDKINTEQVYLKSYKLGMYSEPTDRLFSFREWCIYMQFRKMILSRYYLPMAQKYSLPVDDSVFIEHLKERKIRKLRLSYNVAMDILDKIPTDEINVIPKKNFPVTLTPLYTYTEVILEYIKDPDMKLRLCEDFSQYSLKYVTKDLKLPKSGITSEFLIKGCDETNKTLNPQIFGTLGPTIPPIGDTSVVFVRNCENQNWLKTKPPKVKHVTTGNCDINDNGDDSSCENISDSESKSSYEKCTKNDSDDESCDVIEEEEIGKSIFHDFKQLKIEEDDEKYESNVCVETNDTETYGFHSYNMYDSKTDIHDSFIETPALERNPERFNRETAIQELIDLACAKYKITLPKGRTQPTLRKRKTQKDDETGVSNPKKPKTTNNNENPKFREGVKITQELISAYYENVNNDLLEKISEQVRTAIEMAANDSLEINRNMGNDPVELNENDDHVDELSVDQNASVPDSSIQDGTINDSEIENVVGLLPKTNPKFDPNTHNINQLYVKVNEELELQDIENIDDDTDLNNFIDKKIAELPNHDESDVEDQTENVIDDITQTDQTSSSDDEDNIPLINIKNNINNANTKYLIQNKDIDQYMYWMKHYSGIVFGWNRTMTVKFDNELAVNCPKSFVFVLYECAFVAECSAYLLYKYLQRLEQKLMKNPKPKRIRPNSKPLFVY